MNANLNKTKYPQYRKYLNGMNYFKIISSAEMEEIRFIANKCFVTKLEAKILPDRNLIHDLTFDFTEFAVDIPASEYDLVLDRCKA